MSSGGRKDIEFVAFVVKTSHPPIIDQETKYRTRSGHKLQRLLLVTYLDQSSSVS